jgi:VCBS repeat-containing protein
MAYEQESPLYDGTSNNTLAGADALTSGVKMVAALGSAGDVDFFQINTSGPSLITLDFSTPLLTTASHWQVRLLDSNGDYLRTLASSVLGTPLVNGASQIGSDLNVDGLTSVPAAGSQFTLVTSGADTTVYKVISATPLVGGSATLTLDKALPSGLSDNTALAFDPAQLVTGVSSSVTAAVAAAGSYSIQVLADGAVWNSADYALTATVTPTLEKEGTGGNNTKEDAAFASNRLLANTSMTGALSSASDVDYWVFTTAKPSDFTVSFGSSSSATSSEWKIDITPWSGELLSGGALTAGSSASFSLGAASFPTAQTFVVAVSAYSSSVFNTGNYTLKVAGSGLDLNDAPVLSVGTVSIRVPDPGVVVDTQVVRNVSAGSTTGVRLDSLFSVTDPDATSSGQSVSYYRFSLTKDEDLSSNASIVVGTGDTAKTYGFDHVTDEEIEPPGSVILTDAEMATAVFLPGTTAAGSSLKLALQAYDSTSQLSELGGSDQSGASAILQQTIKIVSGNVGVSLNSSNTKTTLSENVLGEGTAKPNNSSFTLALSQAPANDVKVYLTDANDQLDLSATVLTFTSANYATAQSVTISATADSKNEGASQAAPLSFQVVSQDSSYDGFLVSPLNFLVADNVAPLLATPTALAYTDTDASDLFAPPTSGSVTGTLTASDANSDSLSYGIFGGTDAGTTVSKTSNFGTLTVTKATGAYVFSPDVGGLNAAASSTSADFMVTVSDGAASSSKVLSVSVAGVNDKPVVSFGSASFTLRERGGAGNAEPGTSDSVIVVALADPEGVTSFDAAGLLSLGWATSNNGVTYTKVGTYGTASLTSGTQALAYVLDDSKSATQALMADESKTDTFALQVTDAQGLTQSGTASFSVVGANDWPVLNPVADRMVELGNALSFDLESDLSDVDTADLALTVTLADGSALPAWLSFDSATWTFSGTPTANDLATLSILVTASDELGGFVYDNFDLTVAAASQAAVLLADSITGDEDGGVISGNVLSNDEPSTGNKLSVVSFTVPGETPLDAGQSFTIEGKGELLINTDGSYTFTPLPNVNGNLPVISYETNDGSSTLGITLSAVNDSPTGTVTISGTPNRGQTLTASNTLADADGIPTTGDGAIKYQWLANGNYIEGATASNYTLTQAEVGKVITAMASYTDLGGELESVPSSETVVIAPADTLLTLGVKISDVFQMVGDRDYFKFSVTDPGALTLEFDLPPNGDPYSYFSLELYGPNDTWLSSFSSAESRTFPTILVQEGDYYLDAGAWYFSGQSVAYSLTASLVPGSTGVLESESNDTIQTADALSLDTTVTGQMATGEDLDYFKFSVTAPGVLTLAFDLPIGFEYFDPFTLSLYDVEGVLLNSIASGVSQTYQTSLSQAGDYYLAVSATYLYDFSEGGSYSLKASHVVGSTAGFESEGNNSADTANELTLGEAVKGQLSSYADIDTFKLEALSAGLLTLNFDLSDGSMAVNSVNSLNNVDDTDNTDYPDYTDDGDYPDYTDYSDYSDAFSVRLVDADGMVIASFSAGSTQTFKASVTEAGDYFVEIASNDYYYSAEAYELTASIEAVAEGFEIEPNNYYPNEVQSGQPITGKLSTPEDVDWFFLNLEASSDLKITFDAPTDSDESYFQGWLYDENGYLLVSDVTGRDVEFTVGALDAGFYYFGLSTSSSDLHNAGDYDLTLTALASAVNIEAEDNNSPISANPLALDAPISGNLETADDIDVFSVDLSSQGMLTVNFESPTDSTWNDYFRIDVHDPDGELLDSRNTGVNTAFDVKLPIGGKYTVTIAAVGTEDHSDLDYRLSVSASAAVVEEQLPEGAIQGTLTDDTLKGTEDDDLIYGLGGSDLIDGDAGSDTVVFQADSAELSIHAVGGLTAVRGGYAAGNHSYTVSRLWNVENIKTATDDIPLGADSVTPLLGTFDSDRILGTVGGDLIDGMGGSDFIDGAAGTDTLALFGPSDHFVVTTVAGITRIEGTEDANEYAGHVSRTVGVETLGFIRNETQTLQVNNTAKIFGSEGSDSLTGTVANEIFDGLGGADQVDGGAGSDTLVFFGRFKDFTVTAPTASKPELTIVGKDTAGKDYAGHTVVASNIEKLAFTDVQIDVNNPPGLVVSPASTLLAEGGAATALSLSLAVEPSRSVTVALNGGNQLASSPLQLTFNALNWNTPQTVQINAVDDSAAEKQHKADLSFTVTSDDPQYADVKVNPVTYAISDNDTAGVGSVKGQLWNDADKDGVVDAGEQKLANWVVFDDINRNGRLDTGEASTKSDTSGKYQLDELSNGEHTIVARAEPGWSPTFPSMSNSAASIIVNAAGSSAVKKGEVVETPISASDANVLYSNLGLATNIAAFHADPRFADIKGKGVSVVVVDTGIDLDHPHFGPDADKNGISDRIVFNYDFVGANDNNASDVDGHGTHVAGTVGSSDANYLGAAPEVNIIALRVLGDDGSGTGADIMEALNWVVANASRYNVVAVNLSLGDSSFDTSSREGYLSTQFKALTNAGVVVVSASGNSYADEQIQGVSYPSSDPYSLSVGAVFASPGTYGSQKGDVDSIVSFTQRSEKESDIFAPGVNIGAARNGGGAVGMSGTSMASPEVAGMVALAQQLAMKELGRRLSYEEIRDLLKTTGDNIVDKEEASDGVINTGLTFQRIDMLSLAEAILAIKPPASHTVTITNGVAVEGKNFGFASGAVVQGLSANDFIVGASLSEILRGGAGADQIDASEGDDQIFGELGDDRLNGGAGNDVIDGGAGNDVAVFSGPRANYTVKWSSSAGSFSVSSAAEGADTLVGIETLAFQDVNVAASALQTGVTVAVQAYAWKSHVFLNDVRVGLDAETGRDTAGQGTAVFNDVLDPVQLSATRAATDDASTAAVNLQDAIAILKLVVGLPVNGSGQALSPYQTLAADYNGNGSVELSDAIDVLKYVVGLPGTQPSWKFLNETTPIAGITANPTQPGSMPGLEMPTDNGTSTLRVGLVGFLRGDVDGSYAGAANAEGLSQDYFTALAIENGLNASQFGVY